MLRLFIEVQDAAQQFCSFDIACEKLEEILKSSRVIVIGVERIAAPSPAMPYALRERHSLADWLSQLPEYFALNENGKLILTGKAAGIAPAFPGDFALLGAKILGAIEDTQDGGKRINYGKAAADYILALQDKGGEAE
jgi:hypothetical protein